MVPNYQQEVQKDPKDLRQLLHELLDHLVGLHLDQCRQFVQLVVAPLEDIQVAFLYPPELPVAPLENIKVVFLHPAELPEEQPAIAAAPHFEELQQLVVVRPDGLVTNPPSYFGFSRYDLAMGHQLQLRPPLRFHL